MSTIGYYFWAIMAMTAVACVAYLYDYGKKQAQLYLARDTTYPEPLPMMTGQEATQFWGEMHYPMDLDYTDAEPGACGWCNGSGYSDENWNECMFCDGTGMDMESNAHE